MNKLGDARHMTAMESVPEPNGASFDDLLTKRTKQATMAIVRPYLERMDAIERRQQAIDGDPLWSIRSREDLLTVDDVAGILRCHEKTVRGYITRPDGDPARLPAIVLGNAYRVLPGELADWLERNRSATAHDGAA